MAATLALSICLKYPLFVKGEACDYVNGVGDDVCEKAGFHVLRNEIGKRFAKRCVEGVYADFECREVQEVGRDKYDDKTDDFLALAVIALEIPDAVHQVAIDGAEDESEEI